MIAAVAPIPGAEGHQHIEGIGNTGAGAAEENLEFAFVQSIQIGRPVHIVHAKLQAHIGKIFLEKLSDLPVKVAGARNCYGQRGNRPAEKGLRFLNQCAGFRRVIPGIVRVNNIGVIFLQAGRQVSIRYFVNAVEEEPIGRLTVNRPADGLAKGLIRA